MGMKVMEQMMKHSFIYSMAITQPFIISNDFAPIEHFTLINHANKSKLENSSYVSEEMQPEVSKIKYYENRLNGSFQLLTEQTAKALQSSNHVPMSSKVNSQTVNAISWEDEKSDFQTIEPIINDISLGEKSIDVKLVQEVLLHYGYYHGSIDSVHGTLTEQAINEYRESIKTKTDQTAEQASNQSTKKDKLKKPTKKKKLKIKQNNPEIINHAKSLVGTPYVWGGTTPEGFDCSGYIQYLYEEQNVTIPRTVREIWNFATPVTSPSIGDLVFFETYQSGPSHMGIYLGNNEFIHAGTSNGVDISNLKTDNYWSARYLGTKRIE